MGRGFFHSPVAFGFCLTLLLMFQVSVGVFIAGVLTTLEKQYRLKSSVSGLIISTSDIASLVSTVVVTYIGQKFHRPRIIGILALLIGLGGVLSGLPHFMYPAYRDGDGNITQSGDSVFVCDKDRVLENCTATDIDNSGSRLDELWAMLLGQALMGVAYGPLFPLALTYLDDQVKGTTTPVYIGVFLSAGTSAPLLGFATAFGFLFMNVNWPAPVDPSKEWLGAWWMGFLMDGLIVMILSIPFFFFPEKMDLDIVVKDDKGKGIIAKKEEPMGKVGIRDFLDSSRRIFLNFVFMMIMISTIAQLAIAACFGFYLAKYLELQYNLPAANSALYVGIIIMPSALIGNLSSGFIIKRLNLGAKGCGRLLVCLTIISTVIMPIVYFLSCPDAKYAHVYKGSIRPPDSCNNECSCSKARYEPVCGADGLTYVTPCFAGCSGQAQNRTDDPNTNITFYTGCKCMSDGDNADWSMEATEGECRPPCNMIYIVGVVLFINVMFGSFAKNPLLIMQMRCVESKDKTFGLGLATLFSRAFGFLPAPLYMGAFIQNTCMLGRIECGLQGDCLVYNAQRFRFSFLGLLFVLNVISLIFFIIATIKATMIENKLEREKNGPTETKGLIEDHRF
ncbi:solute carrier organic anion transporter family member 5A1-like isoform X2 [Asterias amurensis]|uniref:solute carrier organic anion transporter family member 5A1-like isoform X2 n=1 Tax=Asterias amurensis TaxID=7602 RepID=UPI003AB604DD